MSVILVSYQQCQYLQSAVDSVLNQTFDSYELIVVDNGSRDGSRELLESYADDPRVRLMLFDEHGNMGLRFNQAIAESRGSLISFLYSDDYYLPNKLQVQAERLDSLPDEYGVVYAAAMRINEQTGRQWVEPGLAREGDVFEHFMLRSAGGAIEMISPMTRRECFEERPFDETVFCESEGIFFRIAVDRKFAYVEEPLTVARDHGANAGKALKRNLEITRGTLTRLREDPKIAGHQLRLVDRYESWLLRRYGWMGARLSPDVAWTRRCFRLSVQMSARHALHPKTVAGMALTFVPSGARARVNTLGHRLRGQPAQARYVEDYEGLAAAGAPGPDMSR